MKHAREAALDSLDDLLVEIRQHAALKEKKRGVFYLRSSAFVHFHEDPAGLFADLRAGGAWTRLPVNTRAQRGSFLAKVRAALRNRE